MLRESPYSSCLIRAFTEPFLNILLPNTMLLTLPTIPRRRRRQSPPQPITQIPVQILNLSLNIFSFSYLTIFNIYFFFNMITFYTCVATNNDYSYYSNDYDYFFHSSFPPSVFFLLYSILSFISFNILSL